MRRLWPLLLAACGAAGGAPARAPRAVVVVRAPQADASLWIDDRFAGELVTLPGGVSLRPGAHRIELRHDGYATRYVEVTLAPGERRVLQLHLAEVYAP